MRTLVVLLVGLLPLTGVSCNRPVETVATKPRATKGRPVDAASIRRTTVESSAIRSVDYDEAARVLVIEFPNRSLYRYEDVPPAVYRGLMAADSHGRYFNAHIRNEGYRYERIR